MSFKRLGLGFALGFALWATAFIARSSTIGIDGQRYFALFDDAMISMRYADNWVHGRGLVWNEGEQVEGYSNLLMVLLMAPPNALLPKPLAVLCMQVLGIGLVLGSAGLTAAIAYRLTGHTLISFLSYLAVLLYYPLAYWSLLGMETGLLTVLVLGAVYLALRYEDEGHLRDGLAMAGLLGLAYWTRPETPLLAGLLLGYVWWAMHPPLRHSLLILTVYSSLPLLQHTFRWWYYGELFANTYTLKVTGIPLSARLNNGWLFIQPYLNEHILLIGLGLVGVALQFNARRVLLVGLYGVMVVYQVMVGGDVWLYWRIMTPVTSLLLVVAVGGMYVGLRRWGLMQRHPRLALGLMVVIIGGSLYRAEYRFEREITLQERPYLTLEAGNNINMALAIEAMTTPDATVGVIWAGIIPYYTEREAIDFLGKSDPYIANLPPDLSGRAGWNGMTSVPGHNKYDLAYSIQQRQPTYVQSLWWGGDDLSEWGRDVYVNVTYKGVSLLLRKDSPAVHWNRIDTTEDE
ncbi:MAG: hypothetical protein H6673_07200 [Anaerolineales bacterium]|nr:hypothetical protein [Anaerolineales bacterium]